MIRINLAKRKTASLAAEQGSAGGGLLSRLRASLRGGRSGGGGSLAEWPIRSLLIALVAVYGSQFFFENEKASALAELDAQVEKLRQAQQELQSKLAQRAVLEERLKEFAANESLVKTKLDTITQLMEGRQAGVLALRSLSSSIPAEVWLQSLSLTETAFEASGQSLDYSQVSDFMKRLGETDLLTDINLDGSSQANDDKGQKVASFKLTAKRK